MRDSSNRFDRPLLAELGPSRQLWLLLALPHLLAAAVWLYLPLAWSLRLAAVCLLAARLLYLLQLHLSASRPSSIEALSWDQRRGWRLRDACGRWRNAELQLPVFVSRRLVAVRFRSGRGRCSVLVPADRLPADDFRRLRVRLLQSAHGHRDREDLPGT